MPNVMKKAAATFAAAAMAVASLGATPTLAQTGTEAGGDTTPYVCNFRQDYYSCCPRYDPCTQIFIGDSSLPPAEPSKPAEPPEK